MKGVFIKAIILAAGSGTRLEKYTKNLPKCMLKVAGKTLIEHQVDLLRKAGIKDIVIVKGYMPEKINLPDIRYYLNKDYLDTNMVETLFCAEKELEGHILVCYSDILYELRVLKKVLAFKGDIGVTADSDYLPYWRARLKEYTKDLESLTIGEKGNIIKLGTAVTSEKEAPVRYVGLIPFSPKGVKALKKIYHKNREQYYHLDQPWLNSKNFQKAYMTDIIQAIINSGYIVKPIIIQRGWLEFDTVEDYEKMQKWLKSGQIKKYINL